jgi:hypothetical protein
MLLRSNGVETVVIGGCTTEGCVESTARDAMFNDHYVVIASDCVASDDPAQHDASITDRHPSTCQPRPRSPRCGALTQRGKSDQWQKNSGEETPGRIAVVTGAASGIGEASPSLSRRRRRHRLADLVGADDAAVVQPEIAESRRFRGVFAHGRERQTSVRAR